MKLVPIADENIEFVRLDLTRHYIQIDCDFICFIVLNPSGTVPKGGTDICALHVGAWQIDSWSFLTDKFTKGTAGFSACLVWDRTKVSDGYKAPQVAESDIDTANSISSLKGQPVNITGFSLAEGESLKVSTLPDEFCNVVPYQDVPLKNQLFLHSKLFFTLKKGTSFDFGQIPSHCVSEIDGGYRIVAPVFSGVRSTNRSTIGEGFSFRDGEFRYFVVNSSSSDSHQYSGSSGDIYVDVSVTDNIISSMSAYYSVCQIRDDRTIGGASLSTSFNNIESLFIEF